MFKWASNAMKLNSLVIYPVSRLELMVHVLLEVFERLPELQKTTFSPSKVGLMSLPGQYNAGGQFFICRVLTGAGNP